MIMISCRYRLSMLLVVLGWGSALLLEEVSEHGTVSGYQSACDTKSATSEVWTTTLPRRRRLVSALQGAGSVREAKRDIDCDE